ncbi:thaumatin-like protein [Punctularia strigosozonata HHB-11173 SS5]|uniref:thaumatin-like protein n=1 Tax=Punctularia strigosozonata (strain HHB-11173) TaxID=741275 RepID=UPI0004416E11|nr:thaumatin-like protein [Punctularia strigosozonata HHB-11173 SS5]EIN14545.1 thaumatin-like protein [Punctularia strigosozonata HHB-11173 SS5]
MTVTNKCSFTVRPPAMFTDMSIAGNTAPDYPTGWEAPSGNSVTFDLPDNWQAGRIWGRRDCDFSTDPGPNSCLTGGCNGGLECATTGGTGVPPATVAEFTFDGTNDNYDVSLVDGYNLPMRVDNTVGCGVPSCPVDLAPNCPSAIAGPFDSTGAAVGCKSACFANLDGDQANSPNCCSGQYGTAATCPSSSVQCEYAYDESSGTALWKCDGSLEASYTITFCP